MTKKGRKWNGYIGGTVEVGGRYKTVGRLRWYGLVERKQEDFVGNQEIQGSRSGGRQKLRRRDNVAGYRSEEELDMHLWKRRIRQCNADPA